MSQTSTSTTNTIIEEITIKGSAERIFEAIVDPKQRVKWWGKKGVYESTHAESDTRVGGKWLMKGIGMGRDFSVYGEYRKVDRPRLLEFTWIPSWQDGSTESIVRFELNEKEGVTTVRLTHSGLTPTGHEAHKGWPQVLGWLRDYVE
jgi:uncharacterized protein YndB with AHSA1/START domain